MVVGERKDHKKRYLSVKDRDAKCGVPIFLSYIYRVKLKTKVMNKNEFAQKHNEMFGFDIQDVLQRTISNLSDLHIEKNFLSPEQMDAKLNAMKEYLMDCKDVLRMEERMKKQYNEEMNEFRAHLGGF